MSEKRIKVTDRRMFTADGELRQELPDEPSDEATAEPSPGRSPLPAPAEPAASGPARPEGQRAGEAAAGTPAEALPIEPVADARPEPAPDVAPAGAPGMGQRPPPDASDPPPRTAPPPRGVLPDPTFLDLVGMLAEPAAVYLGDARLPGGEPAENLDLARLHIDLLDVLKSKTEGNLDSQESDVLVDLIYRLRLRYVQKSR